MYQYFLKYTFIFSLISLLQFNAFATNYYVSNSGNDANTGLSPTLAWKTLTPVNTIQSIINNGQHSILFERGGSYRGSITLNAGGANATQRITYGAYGSGAKPKLLGSTTLGGLTNTGGDVWRMSPGQLIGELFLNDKRLSVARYPNTSYLPITNFSGNSLTHSSLGSGAWNGANVYVRRQNDWIVKGTITSQSGNTINVNIPNGSGQISAGKGFFIDGVAAAMDLVGEWYQEKTAPYDIFVKMPSATNPNTQQFEASILDNGISGGYKYNLALENLDFRYYKKAGFRIANCGSVSVKNCNFKNLGETGIYLQGEANGVASPLISTEDVVIDSCTFYDINSEAMHVQWFKNSTISKNIAKRIGIRAGYELDDLNAAIGFYIHHMYNTVISYNKIDSTGYSTLVWNGELITIERNEMSNNGLTKNDNGFIQAWGGRTKFNMIKDNILHDGHGSEDGMPGVDWTANLVGAAEGIYFDSFTHSNTVTGNTIYNSKNGIFVQSSQNFTISDNTTYNCYWNGLMHHEFNPTGSQDPCAHDCSWSADVINTKTYNNIFYSVRPSQNGIRYSSDVCNSPFNFGTSDKNYIFNPYKTTHFTLYQELCPGNNNGPAFTLTQWQNQRGQEANSKVNNFNWSPFIVATTGGSIVSNGNFDTYINGGAANTNWFANGTGTAIWENNPALNGGTFKASQTGGSADGLDIQSAPLLTIQAGKKYLVSYSIIGNRDGNIKPVILTENPYYQEYAYSPGMEQFSTQRADKQFVFSAPNPLAAGRTYGLHFKTQDTGDLIWLDNISVIEIASIAPDAYLDRSKLFVNNQTTAQIFSLGSNVYKDLDGNAVCGSITVAPYRSRILILDENVNVPTILGPAGILCNNVPTTLTATGFVGSITWEQSSDGQLWNNALGTVVSPYVFTTNTLSQSTYLRVNTNSTVCSNLTSAPYLVTLSGNGKILASKNPICEGESVILTFSGIVGTYKWRTSQSSNQSTWSDAPGLNDKSTYTATGLNQNTTFHVSISGVCGLTISVYVNVTVNPNLNATISYWPRCINSLLSPNVSNLGSGFFSTSTVGIVLNTASGEIAPSTVTGNIAIQYTQNANGACPQKFISTTFSLNPPPPISFQPNLTFCGGYPFTILGTGATVFNYWENNGIGNAKLAVVETAPGVYFYEARALGSGTGCRNSKFAEVTILPNSLPTITGVAALTYCQFANASSADITNKIFGNNIRYYSLPANGAFTTTVNSPLTTDIGNPAYSIWIANSTGVCESPRTKFDINVNVTPFASINPSGQMTYCVGNNVVLTSTSPINNQWYKNGQPIVGANLQFLTVNSDGKYNIKVGTGLCSDTVSVGTNVTILPLPNRNLIVNPASQTICTGTGANISVGNSEAGVIYQPFLGNIALGNSMVGTGANITLTIPSANLTIGGNNITIKATGQSALGGLASVLANIPPAIDGNLTETGWAISKPINTCVNNTGGNCPSNNTVLYGTMWDNTYLYVGVKVVDATLIFNPAVNFWDTDAIEIFIDGDNSKGMIYDTKDKQYILRFGDPNHVVFEKSNLSLGTVSGSGVLYEWKLNANGYTMEVAIPWSRIGIAPPTIGSNIGFDIANDDNDNGSTRAIQTVFAASSASNNSWETNQFTTMPLIGTQNFCESTINLTTTAAVQVNANPTQPVFNYGIMPICSNSGLVNLASFFGSSGGLFSASGGLPVDGISGAISVAGITGQFTVSYSKIASGGCGSVSGFTNLTITSPPITPTFSYGTNLYCNNSISIATTSGNGLVGGTFSATNALTINPSTGLITVNGFVGVSTISYKIAAASGCGSVSGIAVITINSAPNVPSFSYGNIPLCNSTSTITILTGTGLNGGVFSATNGLNINSTNGFITVNSFVGTSLITYSIAANNGCGSFSGMAAITLTSAPSQPTFNYGTNRYCNFTPTINPNIISGVSGGYFGGTGGITIYSITGIISSNALVGTFDITYIIPANGGCASISGMTTITIDGANTTPSMSYSSPVCKSVNILSPIGTNIAGGVFSYSTSGTNVLNINTLTGMVNPSSSDIGNYSIQFAKNANGACSAVSTTTSLIINADDVATFSYPSALICNITAGSVLPSVTGQTLGGNYTYTTSGSNLLSINSSTGEIIPSSSGVGNYTIKYQTVGACAKSATFTLSVGTNPITANFSFTGSSFCSNDANPQAIGVGSGNVQLLSVESSTGVGNLVWTDQIQGIVNLTLSGTNQTYTIKNIVSIVGCGIDTQFADITINAAPNVSISSSSTSVCTADAATLTGVGATSYTWLPSNSAGTVYQFTPTNTSSVTVTGSFANGCKATTIVGITVNSLPGITINSIPSTKTICNGESVTLTGSGAGLGGTYTWLPANVTGSVNQLTPTNTSTITLTGIDTNLCSASSFVTITVNSIPIKPTGSSPAPICVGDNAPILTANGNNLKWYTASTLGIGNISAPNPSAINTAPITVTAFVSQTVNGCESSDRHPITVEVKAIPTITIASNKVEFCFQNPYLVNPTTTGSNGVSNHRWYASTSLLSGSSATLSDTDYVLPTGVNSIQLVATPTQSCGNITTIASNILVITVSSLPSQPNFSYSQTTICSDVNNLSVAPGAANITNATAWSINRPNEGVALNNGTLSINTTASGVYQITATNASGSCVIKTVSSTITISTKPTLPPNLYYSPNTICSDRKDNLAPVNSSLLTGFTSKDLGLVNQNGTIIFPTTVSGYVPITYSISIAGCNPVSTTLGITITDAPNLISISYGTVAMLCRTGIKEVIKLGDDGGTFISSPAGIAVNSITGLIDLSNSKTGKDYTISYSIAGNNACVGIIKSTTVDIIAPTPFSISAPELSEEGICEQNSALLVLNNTSNNLITWKQRKSGESDAQWMAAENSSTNLFKLITPLLSESMEYQVVGGIKECPTLVEKSNLINVQVSLRSKAGTITVADAAPVEPEAEICGVKSSTEITLADYRGIIEWQWASDTDSTKFETIIINNKASLTEPILITPQLVQFNNFKLYRAMVVNGQCPAVFSDIAKVRTCKRSDIVPNALTPNTFDDNATWDIGALRLPDLAEINIYNRYGTLLLKSTGKEMRDKPWDGGGLPAATYYYVIDQANGLKPLSGAVTVIK